jgi:hypothetical protein
MADDALDRLKEVLADRYAIERLFREIRITTKQNRLPGVKP